MSRICHLSARVLLVAAGMLLQGCDTTAPPAPFSGPVPSSGTAANVTIGIVASSGSQAFTPNPAAVPAGQTVAFRNSTGGTHRIVADNGAWDTGAIAPGATSLSISITAPTAVSYHCSIHSSMVGAIN